MRAARPLAAQRLDLAADARRRERGRRPVTPARIPLSKSRRTRSATGSERRSRLEALEVEPEALAPAPTGAGRRLRPWSA